MSEVNLESLMEVVKTKVNELISKPKMADKLLMKPPFRFLHDTITAISKTTGFAEGLYDETELDSAAITEKNAKMAYLDKIFTVVGICKGRVLPVKSARVVSGQEPENTNLFLVDLAECAADPAFDSPEAVRRCLAGELPGDRAPPIRKTASSSAESKSDYAASAAADSKAAASSGGDSGDAKGGGGAKGMPDMEQMAPERGKSRGGTRGGKPTQATADIGLSGGFASSSNAPRLDAEIERCDGSEAVTQQLLGEVISKPKLTEKLLSKPPFRFLHDIVTEVIRSTGFATNLYSAAEMDSANVNEKAQKLLFLDKIIRLVGVQLNTLVEAKPMKIVAGLDPPITNNFLQLLAVAAKHMPDSSSAVRTVLEEARPAPVEERRPVEERKPPPRQAEPKESARPSEERREIFSEDKTLAEDLGVGVDGDNETKRSSRPMSARRRPPKVKSDAKELQAKDTAPAVKKAEGIIIDGNNDDDDDDAIPDETTRLADEVKADAKQSGGGADPQSKLVKDIMSRQAEQEAAGRTAGKPEPAEETKTQTAAQAHQGAGIQLGVRIGRKKDDKKGGTAGGAAGSGASETDLGKMRASIQTLVQHTGPLGTCMDFIQEDISLMTAELHRWEEECRRHEGDVEEAKRKTKEALHPLKVELADIEDQIMEQIAKISAKKAAVARNDDKIQQILRIIATA